MLPGDGCPLPGDQRRQVTVDFPVLETQTRHPTGVFRPEPETPKADDESEAGEVVVGVVAITIGSSGRRRQDADRFIPAHRRRRDPGALRQFRDLHGTGPAA